MAAPAKQALRLGGPVYPTASFQPKTASPEEIAREHVRLGYSAAYCPALDLKDSARIRETEDAFRKANVIIAEVGAWKNLLDPDPVKRKENFDYVESRLALADAVGARCCVDIAGSYNPTVWYGPHEKNLSKEFFDATVENSRRLIDSVKPKRTKFSLEIMGWSLPHTPAAYLQLLKAIDRPAFGVHMDPFNAINHPEKFYDSAALIDDCFRTLGKWIVSCHAKDLDWKPELQVHFVEVIPGRGRIRYEAFLRNLSSLAGEVPLMMEHLANATEYAEAQGYIEKTAASLGIPLASGRH
jgi:sugar phosphate isomerase/epimerase